MIKNYFNIIKPKIVIGNILSTIGGFYAAKPQNINYYLLLCITIGISLVIAASCVLNNIIDRDIDAIMERTKNRILTKPKALFLKKSIVYTIILYISGFLFLAITKNTLIIYLTLIAILVYIGIYSMWIKRQSIYSIVVGSISGSIPPVIGYCAITKNIDVITLIIFIMFSTWQISHSYSILILRLNDYKKALIPIFPIKKGIKSTQQHILIYISIFIISNILFNLLIKTNYITSIIIVIINILWFILGFYGYKNVIKNFCQWAKYMLIASIITITTLNILLILDYELFF